MVNSMVMFTFCFFYFFTRNTLFGQFWFKKSNYQFNLKFGSWNNRNMQNWVVVFSFSVFNGRYPMWANLVQKIKIDSLKLKFGIKTKSNMQNSMVMFTFLFSVVNTLLGQIWSENVDFSLTLKFGTCTNSKMQKSVVMCTFSVLQYTLFG